MKKFVYLVVVCAMLCVVGCGKDDDVSSQAKEFIGNYNVSTSVHLANIPIIGNIDQDIPEMDASIASKGGDEVVLKMGEYSTSGYVTSTGLHVDPIVVSQSVMGVSMDLHFVFPIIAAPVDGRASWTCNISATVSGVGVSGTADMSAVRK